MQGPSWGCSCSPPESQERLKLLREEICPDNVHVIKDSWQLCVIRVCLGTPCTPCVHIYATRVLSETFALIYFDLILFKGAKTTSF